MKTHRVMGVLALMPLLAAAAPGAELPVFTNVTQEAGLRFVHSFGDDRLSNIIEGTGAGCGFFDYDNDGDLDIYLLNGAYLEGISDVRGRANRDRLANALYRNNGDGTFTDVTAESGAGDKGFGMAVAAADIDNDGDLDLYVANYGSAVLYRNNGDGTFTDITAASGLADDRWQIGCTFLDYDNDGFVDLYVGNYLVYDPNYNLYYAPENYPGPLAYHGQVDRLYRNNGDLTFTDVTQESGIYNPDGRAMGVSASDFNNDGLMDIMVANDGMANFFYINNGDGTFTESALVSGTAFGQSGEATSAMGPGFGDFNLDGLIDILVPDMKYGSLYLNLGSGLFEERGAAWEMSAVCAQYISWAGEVLDYDNDGWPDCFIVNGNAHRFNSEADILLRNIEGKRFADVTAISGSYFTREEYVGRGAAQGDFDNDGDVDLLVLNLGGPAILLRNDGGNRNNWLMVKAVGVESNRSAIGARVTVTSGGIAHVQDVRAGSGYLGMSDLRVHFGLGGLETAETVEVRWPTGRVQTLENVRANQILTIMEETNNGKARS